MRRSDGFRIIIRKYPGLVYKLAPMDEKMRKLSKVRNLWEGILDHARSEMYLPVRRSSQKNMMLITLFPGPL